MFPSVASLERLAGAVMCDQDEAWSDARYFSEKRMAELYDEERAAAAVDATTPELMSEWRVVAQKAIDASLELADELGAA